MAQPPQAHARRGSALGTGEPRPPPACAGAAAARAHAPEHAAGRARGGGPASRVGRAGTAGHARDARRSGPARGRARRRGARAVSAARGHGARARGDALGVRGAGRLSTPRARALDGAKQRQAAAGPDRQPGPQRGQARARLGDPDREPPPRQPPRSRALSPWAGRPRGGGERPFIELRRGPGQTELALGPAAVAHLSRALGHTFVAQSLPGGGRRFVVSMALAEPALAVGSPRR